MTQNYEPELGQALFGNPVGGFALPEMVSLAYRGIYETLGTIYWNIFQKVIDLSQEIQLPGIECRPYYWGDDESRAALPNFKFEDVELRFYKHFGRGMSCNQELTPEQWFSYFSRLEKHLWNLTESNSRAKIKTSLPQ